MSRVLKPITVPAGVTITVAGDKMNIKGSKGALEHLVHPSVSVKQEGSEISFVPNDSEQKTLALVGTTRALTQNMINGVSNGFERKLELVGVGYRAQAKGKVLNLTLGFSHPVDYDVPEGITIETPSATEILVKGMDKQVVGQVCADIRAYRPPEPYKGKGIRYAGEKIVRKEAKKK